jgi:ELWxxDGT repeat protein
MPSNLATGKCSRTAEAPRIRRLPRWTRLAVCLAPVILSLPASSLRAQTVQLVKDINPGAGWGLGGEGTAAYNGALYFSGVDGVNGAELWRTDGTDAGTVLVKDINPGGDGSDPTGFIVFDGVLYFGADDGANGVELWRSDGTAAGTALVKNIAPGILSARVQDLAVFNGVLYFGAWDGTGNGGLWKTDGTEAGTQLVKVVATSTPAEPSDLTVFDGALYLVAPSTGVIWKSDGTTAGTNFFRSFGGRPASGLTVFGGALFFSAPTMFDEELWKSDGTTAGTVLLKDINPAASSFPSSFSAFDGSLYFRADDGVNGNELWKTDGTAGGTVLVKDIAPGASSFPRRFGAFDGSLYFRADDGVNGSELWKTDGTTAGTVLAKDINPGGDSFASPMTTFNGALFLGADDGTTGFELRKLLAAWRDIGAGLAAVTQSSGQWGDYDSDGDLDILLTGKGASGPVALIYANTPTGFVDIGAGLTGVSGSGQWGDYDSDGDLDILLTGWDGSGAVALVYENTPTGFADVGAGLTGVSSGSGEWGDYDSDGDLDILLTGLGPATAVAIVYENTSGGFADISAGLTGVVGGVGAWGDYDSDGDLDILLTGFGPARAVSIVYENTPGGFTDIGAGLTGVSGGSGAWGDYDSDGDLDILLTGISSVGSFSLVYENTPGGFTDIGAGLAGLEASSGEWGDFDSDGDLDILVTGFDIFAGNVSRIYENTPGGFVDIAAGLAAAWAGSAQWGDYDADGDLDILVDILVNRLGTKVVYSNNGGFAPNTPPAAPTGLSDTPGTDSAVLSWAPPADDTTPPSGLSYNLRIGTTPGGTDILAPMSAVGTHGVPKSASHPEGTREVPAFGNAWQNTTWTIKDLGPGTYYWSVQAVDNGLAGGPFAPEESFTLSADFGDAPDSYGTLLAQDGARHGVTALKLGTKVDEDTDGFPGPDADGDDGDGFDDEDGVVLPAFIVGSASTATAATFEVTASAPGKLDAWMDLDADGTFDDPAEHFNGGTSVDLVAGANLVTLAMGAGTVNVPVGQSITNYVRFRFSTAGGLGPKGSAPDGEVEDYPVTVHDANVSVAGVAVDMSTFPITRVEFDPATGDAIFLDGNGNVLYRAPASTLQNPVITGTSGDDHLVVDYTSGNPFPNGMTFNAGGQGAGGDALTLTQTGPTGIVQVTHTAQNEHDGSIDVDGSVITYTGLEPTFLLLFPLNLDLNFAGGPETITLNGPGVAEGTDGDGISFADSDASESITFRHPPGTLTLNAGTGNDTVIIGELDSGGATPLLFVVNGETGADTITLDVSPLYPFVADGGNPPAGTCPADVLKFTLAAGESITTSPLTVTSSPIVFGGAPPPLDVTQGNFENLGAAPTDLAVDLVHIKDTAWASDQVIIKVTVTNLGTSAASCVTVDLTGIASILEIDVDNSSGLLTPTATSGTFEKTTLLWTVTSVPAGGTQMLSIPAIVNTALSGPFESTAKVTTLGTDTDPTNDESTGILTVLDPFTFPAKAQPTAAEFDEDAAGEDRLLVGLFQGSPGLDSSLLCRFPAPDGDLFTVTIHEKLHRTCSDGLPYPLTVNDIWRDPDGAHEGRIWLTSWGWGGLYYTDDVNGPWTAVEPTPGIAKPGWVNVYSITEDATDDILYISANNGLLFRSLNGGGIWQRISSLPGVAKATAWSLVAHPTVPGTLYAGTFGLGVYVSTDFGFTWEEVPDNASLLPANAGHIFDLEVIEDASVVPSDFYLYAATGRGVWWQEVTAAAPVWTFAGPTVAGVSSPEIRSLAVGMDASGIDGEPDLYAASWGFGVFRLETPFSGGTLSSFGLRTGNVTMLAVAPDGMVLAATEGGGLVQLEASLATAVDASEALPSGYALEQNYPNPFNPVTTIRYAVPAAVRVRLAVFDLLGREVALLVDGLAEAGNHEAVFDATGLPSGTYIYRMEAPGLNESRILTLLK